GRWVNLFNDERRSEPKMETPLQIDLEGIDARPDIRAEIDKHVAQLEAFRPDHRRPRGREGAEWPSPHRWTLRDHDSPLLA
ncbi:MAG: hypothetical protein WCF62_00195, partial [Pseudolabrys sp.]